MQGGVIVDHQLKAQLITSFFRQCGTDQSPALFAHEVDDFGGYVIRRHDEVAFVFTILIIHHYDHLSIPNVFYRTLDRIEHARFFLQKYSLTTKERGAGFACSS
jgi:hypothetical protein